MTRPITSNGRITYVIRHRPAQRGIRPVYDFEALSAGHTLLCLADFEMTRVRSTLGPRVADVAAAARLLHGRGPDPIVVFGEDLAMPVMAAAALAGSSAPPLHVIYHGKFLGDWRFRMLARVLLKRRRLRFLTISDAVRAHVIGGLKLPETWAQTIGCATDLDFFKASVASGPPMVASAGTASRDYRTLLDATAGLGVPVQIAAASLWFNEALDIDAGQMPSHVSLVQGPMHTGLRDLFARASFVVVPLRDALYGSGYSVIGEAMAMGRAVIVTRTRSPSDFVVDGETGLYVEPGDVAGLRAAIAALIADPERARVMGEAGRRRMEQHFSLDALRARVERFVLLPSELEERVLLPA